MEFVRELPEIVVTEAPTEPIILECELSRKPKDTVKWLKNGKPMPSRLPTNVAIEDDSKSTVHRIIFNSLTDEDLAEYTVQVENIASTGRVDMKRKYFRLSF